MPDSAAAAAVFDRIDHVGVAVHDIDAAIGFYRDVLGMRLVHDEVNRDQGVREAIFEVAPIAPGSDNVPTQVQVLAPLTASSVLGRFLARPGSRLQHVAYTVGDLAVATALLEARGIRLLWPHSRPGTNGSSINFVHPDDAMGVLVELVQRRTGAVVRPGR